MNELVRLEKNVPVVSTLDMWESLGVEHHAVMQLIKKYESKFQEIRTFAFQMQKTKGRPTAFCHLDEEQATFLITLMKNSDVVVAFKFRLTRDFYRMKKLLVDLASQKQNAEWLATRKAGKHVRLVETDTIKRFVDYATARGSQNAVRYYSNISTMQNKALFFMDQKFKNFRDILNLEQLSTVIVADRIISNALDKGMAAGMDYKDIYKAVKATVEGFAEVHGKSLIPAPFKQLPETTV